MEDLRIKEISNGFVVEYDEPNTTGRGREIETYFKTVEELNSFISDYYKYKKQSKVK